MKAVFASILSIGLVACALPETSVRTGSPRPTLFVKGAPLGSELFVDGLSMGSADVFNGSPKVLFVEEGTHLVELRRGGMVVHTEKVFLSNGDSRALVVNMGAAQ